MNNAEDGYNKVLAVMQERQYECPWCDGVLNDHHCGNCSKEISPETCEKNHGLCNKCAWAEAR